MTREEAITVFKAFMDNPLFSDIHKAAFSIAIHDIKQRHDWDINKLMLVPKTEWEQEPTTKNDLGVDCISRQDVLSEIIRFSTEEGSSVECQQLYCDVNNMPSVTPIRPKGHWIDTNNHHYYNDGDIETTELRCSCCNEEVEWDIELFHKPYYCENCGAKMESEG